MKRFLLACICLIGIFGSTAFSQQDVADDEKPPITMPASYEDIG